MATQPASKKRICYYYDGDIGNYYYGQGHPMKPQRMRMCHNLVLNYGLYRKMEIYRPHKSTQDEMTKFHSDEYVKFLRSIRPDNMSEYNKQLQKFNVGEDCPVFDGMYEFFQLSTGGSVAGAVKLNKQAIDIAINWAGGFHHAKKQEASGFCYINDIVLAILELLKYHQRVLYVDIDIHHGDGVEEAFYTTDRVMTVSFHKYGEYFPGTGDLSDIGAGKGKYYAVNCPLRDGMDDDAYKTIFEPVITKVMETFRPSAIVLQCGADSLSGDRLGCWNLTLKGFPNVLGCIDGTFIRIQKPAENEADFVNRKGYHALNVQMCCDPKFRITSCVASWPGSVHDSRVFRTSAICRQFENGHGKAVDFIKQFDLPLLLVGGGGYTIRNVARCWCYETAVALGVEVANELPYNDYFEYYGPDFKLNISPSNMANHNNPEFLEKIKTRIFEHLRMLPHAPGVQMAEIPEDAIDESDNEDTHEDTNKHRDRRVSICASDKRIHRDDEFYDSDDEYPTGGATDMDRDRHKHKHKRPRTETEKNTEHSTEMKDVKTDQKLSETRDTGETSETSKEQEQREEKSTESTDKKDTGDTTKDTLPPEMSDPSKTTDEQEKMDH